MPTVWPELIVATRADASRLSRAHSAGAIRRLAPGVFTGNTTEPLESIARRYLWQIASALCEGAVISDRTALEARPAVDGTVFLTGARARDITLPGAMLRVRAGVGPLHGDTPMLSLFMASRARAYLENMVPSRARRTIARTVSRAELEERLERDLVDRGESFLRGLRDQLRELAPKLDLANEQRELDAIIGTLLGTRAEKLHSRVGRARAGGRPFDERRMALLADLQKQLGEHAPQPRPALDASQLPFFEAYFSNFIEGTEFDVDEARAIVFDARIPRDRPADAHDVLGTYRLVSDPAEMRRVPKSADDLIAILRTRHRIVMEGRPDKHPGEFKTAGNRAGQTVFVAPELVTGTLEEMFALYQGLLDPFARSVFMMFAISEIHPFADGNGRVARIMMNAELVAAGETRIIVPTIFRSNYLSGLKLMSNSAKAHTLVRALDFLQSYTRRVDFSAYERAKRELTETHAFLDPGTADAEGIRLVMPAAVR